MLERKLSSLEKHYYYRSELNVLSCIYLGVELNKIPTKAQLTSVLRQIILEYPQLHCNIFIDEKDGEPYIKSIDEMPILFDGVVEDITWSLESEANINRIFRDYKFPYHIEYPLWKVLINSSSRKMILIVDHILFDGMSCVEFWNEFISKLNAGSTDTQEFSNVLFTAKEDKISVPGFHPYENWPITLKYKVLRPIISKIFEWRPSLITSKNAKLVQFKNYVFPDSSMIESANKGGDYYAIKNDNCQCTLNVPTDELSDVLKTCRSQKVSLTSFLAALMCKTLEESVESKGYAGSLIKIDIPMNTRKVCMLNLNCEPKGCKIGNFVAPLELQYNMNDCRNIWEVAKYFQERLYVQSVDNISDTINNVKLLDVVDNAEFIKEKLRVAGLPGTFEITNLGLQKFDQTPGLSSEFKVEDAFFNEPQGISNIFTCAIISTPVGGLNCSISYPRNIKAEFQPFIERVRNKVSEK